VPADAAKLADHLIDGTAFTAKRSVRPGAAALDDPRSIDE
jgi:hypothetical protein